MNAKRWVALGLLALVPFVGCNNTDQAQVKKKNRPSIVDDSGDDYSQDKRTDKTFGASNDATDAKDATEDAEQKNKDGMDQTN